MSVEEALSAVKVGDLVIDEDTGEILELPAGVGEPIAWLTHRANEAKAAKKAWEALEAMFKAALGRLLIQSDLKKMTTEYGTPGWRSRKTLRVDMDRLDDVVQEFELGPADIAAIRGCVKAYDAKAILELEIPLGARMALTHVEEAEWVQIQPLAPQPPDVVPVKRKRRAE
jgi:hypothetical protein